MNRSATPCVAVIGGGPAGLMAAETLLSAGLAVDLHEAMPTPGRKFLMAGKGGLNITHAQAHAAFLQTYGKHLPDLQKSLDAFPPSAIREWMQGLGIGSFTGSSGRVFPEGMRAAPLLRAWLRRLRQQGLRLHVRQRWLGWNDAEALLFSGPDGEHVCRPAAVVLALGGASWPQLGSDGEWVNLLRQRGIAVEALKPANCGFDVNWSAHFRQRFAGCPLKNIAATLPDCQDWRKGECLITDKGVEGSLVYGLSATLRQSIERDGTATLLLDLLPQWSKDKVLAETARPRGSRSLSSHLQSRLGLHGIKFALLRECLDREACNDPQRLTETIKSLPLHLIAPRPLAEAISSAGGIRFNALDQNLMLRNIPGVFCAGEMLDWEAPTGGYLLSACLATGRAAGFGVVQWLGLPLPATT